MYPRIGMALILILMYMAGCTSKPVTTAELSSDLRAVISLAAEAELFIEQVQAGKATDAYARGHAAYLADPIEGTNK